MNKTIYIIDDDPLFRLIVERMLTRIDVSLNFVHCENGKVGVERVNNQIISNSEFIILLDLNMPVLNGWGFLNEMHSKLLAAQSNFSLYILSSSKDKSDIEKSYRYSLVRKFFHKPLSIDDIMEILAFEKIE